jgi:hypothetical protein
MRNTGRVPERIKCSGWRWSESRCPEEGKQTKDLLYVQRCNKRAGLSCCIICIKMYKLWGSMHKSIYVPNDGYFLICGAGVNQVTSTAAICRPIVPDLDDKWWWLWRNWWNESAAGETEVLGENLTQCRSVHQRSHMTWPGLTRNDGLPPSSEGQESGN